MAIKDSNEDELKDKQDNSEDNFGLPDIEYKPLDQKVETTQTKEEVTSTPTSTYTSSESTSFKSSSYEDDGSTYDEDDEPKSKAPMIIVIVVILILAVSGYLIYNFVIKPRREAAEKARQEQLAKDQEALRQKELEAAAARAKAAEQRRLDSIANAKPKIGTIETLSAPTKRYYVVVTSDIDDDLLMDYAKKLSLKGISTKVIPPFGGKNFFRLAISDHDTFALAQSGAEAAKGEYGAAVWVIKY